MRVNSQEKAELDIYELKYVTQVWYEHGRRRGRLDKVELLGGAFSFP